ncbi:MAG: 4-hydroxymandelate oxidase [Verrucomicrobiales bacterium]|jgi:4-hydroxymandelate oxidase
MNSIEFETLEADGCAAMSPGAAAFCTCGADEEITARENISTWQGLRLRPHVLRDVSDVDVATNILGERCGSPIMVAPMGRHRLFHADGERATASGAANADAIFTLATNSTVSIEVVADQRHASPQWFQLYISPERSGVESLVERAEASGFSTIVLTVDQAMSGWSPRAAGTPVLPSDEIRHVNLPGQPVARTSYDPSMSQGLSYPATIADVEWLVEHTSMNVVVKGILRSDDAILCADAGAAGIVVSNHGGRHLDTSIATAAALPEIAQAVGDRLEVFVDGGIRRGTDVFKALALGADAVLVGRPVLWGLALDGAAGVEFVLDRLRSELARTMALCGVSRMADIGRDLVV